MFTREIREAFIDYFVKNGHTSVPSSPVIPHGDPTLLFTNAGMNQFKDTFLGLEQRSYSRAVSSQKCIRAGGKHNDLDNVGFTARHHTFFEMLGNFSFGDYFKDDAIYFAWEFLTKTLQLPKDKLYVTIFREDDEAGEIWKKVSGLPASRIIKMGEKDNFWSMGDTGPCGPCSEILIDQGESFSCGDKCGIETCDCDRYLELWNLVFMQFNRDSDGTVTSLPRPSIDTGMGLERISAIMQGVSSNYATDAILPLINAVGRLTNIPYNKGPEGAPFRVIADHIRSLTFALADGAYPSNEGRGYVLRKILRRAYRFGLKLNIDQPFLHTLVGEVCAIMGYVYSEIEAKRNDIEQIIQNEEVRFRDTLSDGMKHIEDVINEVKHSNSSTIPGADAFKLYDTYGIPLDIIEDAARDERLSIDMHHFNTLMDQQRVMARSAQKGNASSTDISIYESVQELISKPTSFTGYELDTQQTIAASIIEDGNIVDAASTGAEIELVLEETPFYAESGGQKGDTGTITNAEGSLEILVSDTIAPIDGLTVHKAKIVKGYLNKGDSVTATIDASRRNEIRKHHSATHLLHYALRKVLGDHVRQSGSLVEPDRFRFDFTHFAGLDDTQSRQITELVNDLIQLDLSQKTEVKDIKDAKKDGATALFGEKYGDTVRVVSFGKVSKELCGGTHVSATGQIGCMTIINEGSVATGIRRIEAVCGKSAEHYFLENQQLVKNIASVLRVGPQDIIDKIEKMLDDKKLMEKRIQDLQTRQGTDSIDTILASAKPVHGISVVAHNCGEINKDALRTIGDKVRDKLQSGIIALAASSDDKALFLVMVTKDLIDQGHHAGNLVKKIAQAAGGNGGGRPDMAQAGANDVSKVDEALQEIFSILK